MSIARRIAELYEVKMNAVLDRAADPGEMVDYTYVQLQELLAEVRRGVAGIAASREQAESRAGGLRQVADRLGEQAEQAVQAGRDDLARQALARRAAILAQVSRLREQQDALRAEEQKISDAGQRLQEKIEAFGMQREAIKAAYTAARAQASIAEAFAGISGDVTDADAAARHAEDEQADLEARARGLDDLLTPPLSDEQLQAQLDQISTRAQVDEELARLRERLAAGGGEGHRPSRIPLTCVSRHGLRRGRHAWPRRSGGWWTVSRSSRRPGPGARPSGASSRAQTRTCSWRSSTR